MAKYKIIVKGSVTAKEQEFETFQDAIKQLEDDIHFYESDFRVEKKSRVCYEVTSYQDRRLGFYEYIKKIA